MRQNTQNGTYITIKRIGKCGPCPVFASYILTFALKQRKKHGKTSVRVVEKYPNIPVAAVLNTFTHKHYRERHNETGYTERNIHNSKKYISIYIYTPYLGICWFIVHTN
jgi:hypothetical protein